MNEFLQSLRGGTQKDKRTPKTRRVVDNENQYGPNPGFHGHGNYQGARGGNVRRPGVHSAGHVSPASGPDTQVAGIHGESPDVMAELLDTYNKNQELLIGIQERRVLVEERKAIALEEIAEYLRVAISPSTLKKLLNVKKCNDGNCNIEDGVAGTKDFPDAKISSGAGGAKDFPDAKISSGAGGAKDFPDAKISSGAGGAKDFSDAKISFGAGDNDCPGDGEAGDSHGSPGLSSSGLRKTGDSVDRSGPGEAGDVHGCPGEGETWDSHISPRDGHGNVVKVIKRKKQMDKKENGNEGTW
ncbi:MAG: hypothetical protein HQK66_10765, partial [Desulfamplus sp.]|nr:hypothetical protein [Desulfamplus sp.]